MLHVSDTPAIIQVNLSSTFLMKATTHFAIEEGKNSASIGRWIELGLQYVCLEFVVVTMDY